MAGERCLQQVVQDFEEDSVVAPCGEVVPCLWSGAGAQPHGRGLACAGGHASSLKGQGEGFLFLQEAVSRLGSRRTAQRDIQV